MACLFQNPPQTKSVSTMKSGPAPVAVFADNRPDHLEGTLQSLIACEVPVAPPITLFIDRPKSAAGAETAEPVRRFAKSNSRVSK